MEEEWFCGGKLSFTPGMVVSVLKKIHTYTNFLVLSSGRPRPNSPNQQRRPMTMMQAASFFSIQTDHSSGGGTTIWSEGTSPNRPNIREPLRRTENVQ